MSDIEENNRKTTDTPCNCRFALFYLLGTFLITALLFFLLYRFDGIDGVILSCPILFFSLLAGNVFFLASGLNHLIGFLKRSN
jgi:hypothetical protein